MTAAVGSDVAALRHGAADRLGRDGIVAVAMLLAAAVALAGRVSDQSFGPVLLRALWWVIYLAAVVMLVRRFGIEWLTWTIRRQPALCVLLALAGLSCLWSLAPPLTLQKSASLLGTTVVGVFIGYSCPGPRLMRVLHWTFLLVIASSIVVSVMLPTPVGDGIPIGWRGVMGHKNGLGAVATLAAIFYLVSTATRRIHPLWGAALIGMCLLSVAQSRSGAAWVTLTVLLGISAYLAVAWTARQPTGPTLRRLSLALVLAVSVLPFLIAPLEGVLGKNDPLNGRARLWSGALTIARERPLTGYGYAVVWGRHGATLLPHIPVTANRSAANAHNSIVDVATQLGIPAAIVACMYLFGSLASAARLFERQPSAFAFFALVFLVGVVVLGFSEAHLLKIHWILWILFVAVTVAVTRSPETEGGAASSPLGNQR